MSKMVTMYNKGKRTWKFGNGLSDFPSGQKMEVPEEVAEKYAILYPREFEIIKAPEATNTNKYEPVKTEEPKKGAGRPKKEKKDPE
jgi:hypothetical protein